jgi:hypothetical protein
VTCLLTTLYLYSINCHKLSVTHLVEHPLSHSQCLSVTLGITQVPQHPPPTHHPPGHSHRVAALCQACFLLLCSESSATACSSKDFLLSGPSQVWPSVGHTAQGPGAGQQESWALLPPQRFWLCSWDFPSSSSVWACVDPTGWTERVICGPCPTPRVSRPVLPQGNS